MSQLMARFFGPLDSGSCVYFFIIAFIFFVLLIITLFGQLYVLIKDYKQINFKVISGGVIMLFNLFIAYFVNRLLYTMCTKSLA